MTAKEYLMQVQKLEYKISRMKLRSEEYERLSHSIAGPNYDREPVSGTRNLDAPFVKWILKKADLDREIESLEEKLVNLKAEIMLTIEKLDSEDYKNVLVMHYINGLPFVEVAEKLYLSESTVFRWHRCGLESLESLIEKMTVNDSR